ncbi:MAG: glycosyltransferase, partial [Nitrososphaerales archaeon]
MSVIIPAYNAAPYIVEQLASLAQQDYEGPFEVIIADNGSQDDTVGVAQTFVGRLDLRVVDASTIRGGGPARNVGVEASSGQLLVFADADDVATTSWLSQLVAASPRWDLTAGPYDYKLLNSPVVQAWGKGWPMERLPGENGNFLPFAFGGNLAVWRQVFQAVGGFCKGFSEDVDFSWRAQLAGYRLGFAPNAIMYHRDRPTMWSHALQFMRWGDAECRNYRTFRDQGMLRRPLWRGIG